jgi:hypothetical protein
MIIKFSKKNSIDKSGSQRWEPDCKKGIVSLRQIVNQSNQIQLKLGPLQQLHRV